MTRFLTVFLALLCLALALALPVPAQDAEADKSRFTRFVENQLSAENRRIRLSGIAGALSSEAAIDEITVADRQGVWLRIVGAEIVWTRAALLRGRLDIERLAADRIEMLRQPLPAEGAPPPEAGGFSVPELPVAIALDQFAVPNILFDEAVFGLQSRLSAEGSLSLAGGALEAALDIERRDGPGGSLALDVAYANDSERLDLDLRLDEPENGILANALNMAGRPAIGLQLTGSGPLSDLVVDLGLAADGEPALAGTARFDRTATGLAVATDLDGRLARLIAPPYRPFFGEETRLSARALLKESGGLRLDRLTLDGGATRLSATAETTADGFLSRLALEASVGAPDGGVTLPVPGGTTRVDTARLAIAFGADAGERWSGSLSISRLDTPMLGAGAIALDFGGVAAGLQDPTRRRITFSANGSARAIASPDSDIAEAIGDSIAVSASGRWRSGQPLRLQALTAEADALLIDIAGDIADTVFDGSIELETDSLAPFAGLAGRPLSGRARLSASGTIEPISGAFDLTVDGSGAGLATGTAMIDALLRSPLRFSGGLARGAEGIAARDLTLENSLFSLVADGRYASDRADFGLDVVLSDLALVSERASGRLTASARLDGRGGPVGLRLEAAVPSGRLAERRLQDATIRFAGALVGIGPVAGQPYGNGLSGDVDASAFVDGERALLAAEILATPDIREVGDLLLSAGGARLTGGIRQDATGLLDGELIVEATDIETAAALATFEASGAVDASIRFVPRAGRQDVDIRAQMRALRFGADGPRIGRADIEASIGDLFGVPKVAGSIAAADMLAAGLAVAVLEGNANRQGTSTVFSAVARLQNDTRLDLAGQLEEIDGGVRLAIRRALLERDAVRARLRAPAAIEVIGDSASIDPVRLDIGGGKIVAQGAIGESFDVDIEIDAVPLSIANAVRPDLDLGGTVSGSASVSGPRRVPQVSFDIAARSLGAAALRRAGLAAVDLTASGRTADDTVTIDAELTAGGGVRIAAAGRLATDASQTDLDITIDALPLAALDGLAGGQRLQGMLSGSATVSGPLAGPAVAFDVAASGLSAAPLAEVGIGPLSLAGRGRYGDGVIIVQTAQLTGSEGLSIEAGGRIPLDGAQLSVQVSGRAPLSIANRPLAERGTRVSGSVDFSLDVSGSITDPRFSGMIATSNATLFDPDSRVRFETINVIAGIDNDRLTLSQARGTLVGGGTIAVDGGIGLDPASGFPADLAIALDQARYSDGDFLVATASGRLTIRGALTRDPLIEGAINVDRAEIGIPDNLADGARLTDIEHVNTPADVARTLAKARLAAPDAVPVPTARPSVARLDITLNAPNRIFLRGRGLDAELGGSVRVRGPITGVEPVGAFELIRGRLSIVGRRIVFEEGSVTLIGDLDPFINLVARSQSGETTVIITITGRASDPDIAFSSQPALPQDEVLARLIFDRSLSELSGFQIAQLAAAVAELAGGEQASLLGRLRSATGLDDLDVVADEEGNAAVRAGRYIQDNVYLGVQAGADGSSEVTIDLDITENLKARGGAGADGDNSIGLFYERDY